MCVKSSCVLAGLFLRRLRAEMRKEIVETEYSRSFWAFKAFGYIIFGFMP